LASRQRQSLPVARWREHAAVAIVAFLQSAGGAVVWPEVEAALARSNWYSRNVSGAPALRHIDPHHLTYARRILIEADRLVPESVTLNGRLVTAYLDAGGLARRERTRISRLAASKRRLYRRFVGWTADPRLCGQILERQVHATLDAMRHDVLTEQGKPGQISTISGQSVSGGPVDHAGFLRIERHGTGPEFIGLVVEDKNVRSILYPRAREVWDLLAKACDFPNHVPILVTAHVHRSLLTFFKAVGAVVYPSRRQWFAPNPAIRSAEFNEVVQVLKLDDAVQLLNPDEPSRALKRFFDLTLRTTPENELQPLILRSQERWSIAAPVCARYRTLREESLSNDQRLDLWEELLEELAEVGINVDDLRRQERVEESGYKDLGDLDID
jgi:hypothetical protein